MKLKITINNRWTGKLIFELEAENNTVAKTLRKAIEAGADLEGADLRGTNLADANLRDANLRGANLRGADLEGADLEGADLEGADLEGADLRGTNLADANLRDANLRDANLRDANLRGANLADANLRDANLRGANLADANLAPLKNDLFIVLLYGRSEVKYLKENLLAGNIDGSCYDGACSCLSGTLERGAKITNGPTEQLKVDSILSVRNSSRPIERLFLGITKGDTKESNPIVALVLNWIEEFEQLLSR